MIKIQSKLMALLGIGLVLHSLYLFLLSPLLFGAFGEHAAQMIYLVFRLLSLLALPAFSVAWLRYPRFNAIVVGVFFEFLAQVPLKALWMTLDFQKNAALWSGTNLKTLLFQLPMSYFIFTPMVVIFSFLGYSLGVRFSKRTPECVDAELTLAKGRLR